MTAFREKLISLILSHRGRDVMAPLVQKVKRLAVIAQKSGELKNDNLAKNPHLLLAPIWAGIVINRFLDRANPINIGELFQKQLDMIFSKHAA